jgi:precorrin-2/cobalt-factor-2 C20-methyltransferase
MKPGVLYGIGVGPGDPELITMKGVKILARCRHIFVPITRIEKKSTALAIAKRYVSAESAIHELIFPMTTDQEELQQRWDESAQGIASVLMAGEDACFLTLGDPFLYSTYIYLLRALRRVAADVEVATVPGVTAFSAAAALTEFAVGEGNESVRIVPAADNIDTVRDALLQGGTVIIMKVGRQLTKVLDLLEELGLMDQGVFVSRAGLDGEYTALDLRKLREEMTEASYFSIMLVHAAKNGDSLPSPGCQ